MKVGDRIVIVKGTSPLNQRYIGEKGEIVEFEDQYNIVCVKLDLFPSMKLYIRKDAIELDKQTHMQIPLELNDTLLFILGRPSFTCMYIVGLLREEIDIPRKAEAEQAHVIHWMLKHYTADPENWREQAEADLRRLAQIAQKKQDNA